MLMKIRFPLKNEKYYAGNFTRKVNFLNHHSIAVSVNRYPGKCFPESGQRQIDRTGNPSRIEDSFVIIDYGQFKV
jgi:hypothetical protein